MPDEMPALAEADPASLDMDPEAVARAAQLFEEQHTQGLHPGAQLAVFRHGRPVLDRHIGLARREPQTPVGPDTLFLIFSASKPFASACIFKLIEEGRLSLDDRVAKHWPEFGRNGKKDVTIEHVLTHQVGIPYGPAWLGWREMTDADATARAMAELTPQWTSGEAVGYHPLNYGWMVREIVRRVSGRSIGRFLREEILEPLRIRDVYLGLPPELEGRVATHYLMPGYAAPTRETLPPEIARKIGDFSIDDFNRPEMHAAELPAAGIIATARDVARFYVMLLRGGELDGVRVLEPESVAKATSLAVHANPDRSLGLSVRWGYGFHLGDTTPTPFGLSSHPHAFGHSGAGCTIAWADPDIDVAFAYLTNGERDFLSNARRFLDVAEAIRAACR
jgi:CubicO group peptidase (beta-lactamase class C family)